MADTTFEKAVLLWLKDGADEGLLSIEEMKYLVELVERDIELKEF